jgi:plastocyanin
MLHDRISFPARPLTSVLSIAVLGLFTVSGCSDSKSTNNNGDDPKFTPQIAEIVIGDTIRWTSVSGLHTVTSGTGSADFSSGQLFDVELDQGQSFPFVFGSVGSFAYFCRPHEADGMTGTVNVSAVTAKTVSVNAAGTSFSPRDITIQAGDAVKWTASGSHTVTSGTGSVDPSVGLDFDQALSSGQTFTFIFTTPGTYPYFCRLHESSGMKGTVTVTEVKSKTVQVEASI